MVTEFFSLADLVLSYFSGGAITFQGAPRVDRGGRGWAHDPLAPWIRLCMPSKTNSGRGLRKTIEDP